MDENKRDSQRGIRTEQIRQDIRDVDSEIAKLLPELPPDKQAELEALRLEKDTLQTLLEQRDPGALPQVMRLAHLRPAHAAILVLIEEGGDRGEMPYRELMKRLMRGGVLTDNRGTPWKDHGARSSNIEKGIKQRSDFVYIDENGSDDTHVAKLTPEFYEFQRQVKKRMRQLDQVEQKDER